VITFKLFDNLGTTRRPGNAKFMPLYAAIIQPEKQIYDFALHYVAAFRLYLVYEQHKSNVVMRLQLRISIHV